MTIRVTIGSATIELASQETRNGVGVISQRYEADALLHAVQRTLEATSDSCPHVQTLLSSARRHIDIYDGLDCESPEAQPTAAGRSLERYGIEEVRPPLTIAGRIQRLPPDPGIPQAGPVRDEGGPPYDEISPALKDSLRHLVHEYGAAGVERTLRLMIQQEALPMRGRPS